MRNPALPARVGLRVLGTFEEALQRRRHLSECAWDTRRSGPSPVLCFWVALRRRFLLGPSDEESSLPESMSIGQRRGAVAEAGTFDLEAGAFYLESLLSSWQKKPAGVMLCQRSLEHQERTQSQLVLPGSHPSARSCLPLFQRGRSYGSRTGLAPAQEAALTVTILLFSFRARSTGGLFITFPFLACNIGPSATSL